MVVLFLRGTKVRSVLPATVQMFVIQSSSLLCPDEQWINNVDSWHIISSTWLSVCWSAWARSSSIGVCPTFCRYEQTSQHAVTCDSYFESCPSDHN